MAKVSNLTREEWSQEALVPEAEQPYKVPENWVWARLKSCVKRLQYGYTQSSSQENIGPKFLRITDIQDGQVNWEKVPFCEITPKDLDKYKVHSNDIVVARTGATTGKSFLVENPPNAVFASYLIRLSPAEVLEPKYLWLFMNSDCYWKQITVVSKGIAQPGANASVLGNLAIPFPPLLEQKRIVTKVESLLSKINEAKQLIEEARGTFAKRHAGVLMKAFRGELTKKWREDNTSSNVEEIFRQLQIKSLSHKEYPYLIPDSWRFAQLGGLAKLRSGATLKSEYELTEGDILYIKVSDMNLLENKKEIKTSSRFTEISKVKGNAIIPANSIIFPKRGGAILTNKKRLVTFDIVCDLNIMAIICPKEMDIRYLYYWFLTIDLATLNNGSSVPQINNKDIEPLKIPVPPLEEQLEIASILDRIFNLEEQLIDLSALDEPIEILQQAILSKAFRGELDSNDLE